MNLANITRLVSIALMIAGIFACLTIAHAARVYTYTACGKWVTIGNPCEGEKGVIGLVLQ